MAEPAGRDVVVVGAGIAGLAAAYELRDLDVLVIEGSRQIGGKLRTSAVADVEIDEGAESFLARVPEAIELATAVGLGAALTTPVTTTASVWAGSRLRPIPPRTLLGVPSSARSLLGVLPAAGVARAAADAVLPGRAPTGDESVGALVQRRLGRGVVDLLVDPLLGGVYAGRADELSVQATLPALAAVRGSLLRAVQRTVPAPGQALAPVFQTVTPGLGRLPAAVGEASRATVRTGRPVRRIERTATGFRVVHGPTVDEQVVDTRAVVVAVPAAPAARLLDGPAPTAATELAGIDSASMAIVTAVWRRPDLPPTSGSGYLVPAVTGRPVKAVTFASAKWSHVGTGELAAVRMSIGRYGDAAVLQRDDDELIAVALQELRSTTGVTAAPVATRLTRWGGALPQYAVGHVDRVARIRAAVDAVPGLAICGAAYEGVGIPACIRTARAAAARVRLTLEG
jgi:oxygen-dependent protoporphyrinogen oxidase